MPAQQLHSISTSDSKGSCMRRRTQTEVGNNNVEHIADIDKKIDDRLCQCGSSLTRRKLGRLGLVQSQNLLGRGYNGCDHLVDLADDRLLGNSLVSSR